MKCRPQVIVLGALLALLATLTPTTPAGGAGDYETLPALAGGVDGPAHTAELIGDQLWIGGSFGSARNYTYGLPDHPTRNLAVIDINTGEVRTDRAFDLPSSDSYTIDFSHGDTVTGGAVFGIASDGETVWVGGSFESAEGQPRTNLAAYDARTGDLIDSFAPTVNGRVIDLLHIDGALYVAGAFTRYNGSSVGGVVKVDPSTATLDNSFSSGVAGGEAIWTLDHHGDRLYVGGTQGVNAVNAATGTSIAQYFSGGTVAGIDVSDDGTRLAIAHENNNVYAHDLVNDRRLWSNGGSGPILSVAWAFDQLFVGTTYHWDSSQDRRKVVALDAQTGQLDQTDFFPQLNSFWAGRSLLATPQGLIATGDFSKIAVGADYEGQDGINARRVAVFRPTGAWLPAPPLVAEGDVTCDGIVDLADVMAILEYGVGRRADAGSCPLADPATQLHARAGDVDGDGVTGLRDALHVARSNAAGGGQH